MRRHLERGLSPVMLFPAISAAQAVQLGVAAQTAGTAAASAFADMLRSAASLLAPADGPKAAAECAEHDSTRPGAAADLSVLRGQIDSLLARIGDRVRQLLAGENRPLPEHGVTLADDGAGNLAVGSPGEADAALPPLLQQDGLLRSLFRALTARRELLNSASSPANPAGPTQLRVAAAGAATIAA